MGIPGFTLWDNYSASLRQSDWEHCGRVFSIISCYTLSSVQLYFHTAWHRSVLVLCCKENSQTPKRKSFMLIYTASFESLGRMVSTSKAYVQFNFEQKVRCSYIHPCSLCIVFEYLCKTEPSRGVWVSFSTSVTRLGFGVTPSMSSSDTKPPNFFS